MAADSQNFFDMAWEIDAMASYLNGKEQDFIEDVLKMSDAGGQLTEKQQDWIQKIWDKTVDNQ